MALHFLNDTQQSTAASSHLVSAVNNDTYLFGASALYVATGDFSSAMRMASLGEVDVYGSLIGYRGIDDTASSSGNVIVVEAGGSVYGSSAAISLQGYASRISNFGSISGEVYAGSLENLNNAGMIHSSFAALSAQADVYTGATIINSGTIFGDTDGVQLAASYASTISNSGTIEGYVAVLIYGAAPVTLTNSGIIQGKTAIYFDGPDDDAVVNSGTISGPVQLGDGDDSFDSRAGHMLGMVSGQGGDDRISTGADNDTLDGGAGSDDLNGGDGDDVASYADATTGLLVDLASPDLNTGDAAGDAFTSIEGLIGSGLNDALLGDAGVNRLWGAAGDDTLNGRAGGDILRGGEGNDAYLVDSSQDRVIEKVSNGTDTVISTVSNYTLSANVENLVLGAKVISGHGNALDNHITGNSAANVMDGGDGMDVLDGGKGADTMTGGNGWDTYYVDNVGDQVIEAPGDSNSDTVNSTITYSLPQNVEILFLGGAKAINATGNGANNLIGGNGAANVIDGLLGNDQLSGGEGADQFRFSTALDSSNNLDTIFDFTSGSDGLQLSKSIFTALGTGNVLGPDQFYVGTAAHDQNDHIIYDSATGNLYYDPDGTGAQSQVEFASLSHGIGQPVPTLVASDIHLIV